RSVGAAHGAMCFGRWFFHAFRGFPRPLRGCSGRLLSAVAPASGTSRTFYRYRPKTCWPTPNGAPLVGAPARKESSRLVLLRSACGLPTDHRSGSRVSNICPARGSERQRVCPLNISQVTHANRQLVRTHGLSGPPDAGRRDTRAASSAARTGAVLARLHDRAGRADDAQGLPWTPGRCSWYRPPNCMGITLTGGSDGRPSAAMTVAAGT